MNREAGQVQVTATGPFTAALLRVATGLDRFMYQLAWVSPLPLAIDGAAYRRRTRRRKP